MKNKEILYMKEKQILTNVFAEEKDGVYWKESKDSIYLRFYWSKLLTLPLLYKERGVWKWSHQSFPETAMLEAGCILHKTFFPSGHNPVALKINWKNISSSQIFYNIWSSIWDCICFPALKIYFFSAVEINMPFTRRNEVSFSANWWQKLWFTG